MHIEYCDIDEHFAANNNVMYNVYCDIDIQWTI